MFTAHETSALPHKGIPTYRLEKTPSRLQSTGLEVPVFGTNFYSMLVLISLMLLSHPSQRYVTLGLWFMNWSSNMFRGVQQTTNIGFACGVLSLLTLHALVEAQIMGRPASDLVSSKPNIE